MENLTKIQEEIYAYVAGYITDNGYSPTSQEIAISVGTSTQAIDAHIKNIVLKGWIKFNGKKHRRIELIPEK